MAWIRPALAGGTSSRSAAQLLSAAIVFAAAVPFAGWRAPALWLLAMAGLVMADHRRAASRAVDEAARPPRDSVDPIAWSLSAGHAAAATYLLIFYTGAAQTLGVTLFGVVMFEILARDYTAPRRLMANLSAPVAMICAVQLFAAWLLVHHGEPWKLLTLLATPLVVFRAFRAVQLNLARSHRLEQHARKRLRESESKYRLIAEGSPDVIVRYNLDGRVEYLSPAARNYGWDPDDLQDAGLAKSLGAGGPGRGTPVAGPATGALPPQADENVWRARAADGRLVSFERRSSPVIDEAGRIAGAVAVMRDVTERLALEEELRASEARHRLLAERSTDIILQVDLRGVVQYVSPACRLLGYEPPEMVGRHVMEFVDPRDAAKTAERVQGILHGRAPDPSDRREQRVRCKAGGWAWLEGSPTPLRDEHGAIVGGVTTLRDISERKALEAELVRKKSEAETASVAKSEFLATVSHEIRTPLNGVLGMAQAMARDVLSDRQRERLDVIRQSGASLLAMLNDILDISKIEAGRLELEAADFDLGEIVLGAHAVFTATAHSKGLSFNLQIDEAARGVYRGDSVRVRQVLHNLVSNAIKFTESGEVRVILGRTGHGVRMEVRDTGVGIDPDRIDRLFEKFVQADASTTRRFGGTGLGLAICAELCRAMGGTIQARSVPGEGSTFVVDLPLERIGDRLDESGLPEVEESPAEFAPESELRVLAAEDNQVNQIVLKTLLAQLGLWPAIVETGEAAVEAWEREPWDLILMDVQMPVMDGPTATRAIRAREAETGRARTPIIALTANAMTHQLEAYRAAGMDGIVAKPINMAELFAAISATIDGPAQPAASPPVRAGAAER
jgi:PAS domain S-box-containing protein